MPSIKAMKIEAKRKFVAKAIPGGSTGAPHNPKFKTHEELKRDREEAQERLRRKHAERKERKDNEDYGQW